jgi:hypothetical protein
MFRERPRLAKIRTVTRSKVCTGRELNRDMNRTRIAQTIALLMLLGCTPVTAPVGSCPTDANRPRAAALDSVIDGAAPDTEPGLDTAPEPRLFPPDPLHVFATLKSEDETGLSELHVCPIRGVTWLCGLRSILSVQGGAVEHVRASEAGLPVSEDGWLNGGVDDIVGHWPDDAWLMLSQGEMPPPEKYAVYRWRDRRWKVSQPQFTCHESHTLRSWGPGGALIAESASWRAWNDGPLLRGLGIWAGTPSAPSRAFNCARAQGLGAVMPLASGGLFAAIDNPCGVGSVVEHWASPSAAPKVERLPIDAAGGAKSIVVEGFEGEALDDVTVFGNEYYGGHTGSDENPDRAYIAHFDGNTWSKETAPPDSRTVGAYIRNAAGSSWAIANSYDHPELWSKVADGPWTRVPIPAIDPIASPCEPSHLSKAEDLSVWVWCSVRPSNGSHSNGPNMALLSTLAPSRVVELEKLL